MALSDFKVELRGPVKNPKMKICTASICGIVISLTFGIIYWIKFNSFENNVKFSCTVGSVDVGEQWLTCMKFGAYLFFILTGLSVLNIFSVCIKMLRCLSSLLNGAATIACITQLWMMFVMRLDSAGYACATDGNAVVKEAGLFLRNMIISQFCLQCCLNTALSTSG